MTNYERIKNMSIDELTEFFLTNAFDVCEITNAYECRITCENDNSCEKCLKQFLESEVKAE